MRATIKWLVAAGSLILAGAARGETQLLPSLKIAAEERYDDADLLRTADGQGQLITKISPQVGASLEDETLKSTAWYSPDLLLHTADNRLTVDHRGFLEANKRLTRHTEAKGKAQVWRVSDPTSLPRLGLARTLSPILYGKLDLSTHTAFTERLDGAVGYRFEGAQVYEPGRAPGYYHAPFAESFYALSRRTAVGAEYRFQYFTLGADAAHANGAFAAYRYRLTRLSNLVAKAGPIYFQNHGNPDEAGWLPKATLELNREGESLELFFTVGQDLVGASGFTSALWADFASVVASYKFISPFRAFAAANYFRNGRAPSVGLSPFGPPSPTTAQGYAVGGGVEWRASRHVSVLGTFDRFAQVGAQQVDVDVTRNIAAVRLVVTAL